MANILVIDDEFHIRELLKRFLQIDGHQVAVAENGAEGLKLVADTIFDLIITDIVMPEKDGFEVIMELFGQSDHPKIMTISGGSLGLDANGLMSISKMMGAVKVIAKPIDYEILSAAVREVLA